MDNRRDKRRGPITIFVDWLIFDPVTTGLVIAAVVALAFISTYFSIRAMIDGRF